MDIQQTIAKYGDDMELIYETEWIQIDFDGNFHL